MNNNTTILITSAILCVVLLFVYMRIGSGCPQCPMTPIGKPCPRGRNASITTCKGIFGAYFQGLSRDLTTLYTQLENASVSPSDLMMVALDTSNKLAYSIASLGNNESEEFVNNLVMNLVNGLDLFMKTMPNESTQKILNDNNDLSYDLQNFRNNLTYVQNEIHNGLWPNIEKYRFMSSGY